MTTWYTARELAGLPGMPGSERRTRDRLMQLGIPSRTRVGKGGGCEYDPAALPTETRQALLAIHVTKAAPVLQAEPEAVASFQPSAPVPPQALVKATEQRRQPSQADKAVADARMVLVHELQELAGIHGTKKAASLLALQLAVGQCSAELAATARMANQRARHAAVSARTLERWLGVQRNQGWWGLLPVNQELAATEVEPDVAAVLGHYLSRDPMFRNLSAAAKHVTKQLGRERDTWPQLYQRARRRSGGP